jgi:hypothetical protein
MASAIFPHEYMYKMLLSGVNWNSTTKLTLKDSWMLAAAQEKYPNRSAGLGRQYDGKHFCVLCALKRPA